MTRMKMAGWLLACCGLLLAGEGKRLTYEQALLNRGEALLKPLPFISGWSDDQSYHELRGGKIYRVLARSGKSRLVLDPAPYAAALPQGLTLLQANDNTPDYRLFVFVHKGDLYLFRRDAARLERLTETPGDEQNPQFSPDGRRIAYTREGNLYVCDLASRQSRALTRDGSATVLNGHASWVYYEEILGRGSRYRAFWWSPDSLRIAFMRFDQERVPEFPLFQVRGDYGQLEIQRYPKAGYPNPQVRLGVADAASGDIRWVPEADAADHYLALPRWSGNGGRLYFQWANRDQNWMRIFRFDPASGRLEQAYEEKQATWVEFGEGSDYQVLPDGGLLLVSSREGWPHLYRVAANGGVEQLTRGDWSVSGISLVDAARKRVLFTARREDSTELGLYEIPLAGGGLRRLTGGPGMHRVSVSPGGSWFTDFHSALGVPPRLLLWRGDGRLQRQLGDSRTDKLAEYDLGRAELFRIPTSDGLQLPAAWILPPGFDPSTRYPVVLNVYGGPGAASVGNAFGRGFAEYYLAQQGIIVMTFDHRGSGHFGKKGEDLMHRQLGKWELNDLQEAVRHLRSLPFVDGQRIGITGGSYGGYVAALALLRAGDLFRCGIADFAVTDWRLYDSVYTERYMDTPEQNPDGYRDSSLLHAVDGYRGGLRIAHGSMDDNVHMQNALQLIDRLQDAGKSVELMIYPGERHGFRGPKSVEYRRANLDFWCRHFFNRPFVP